jgi:hypothetical protein
MPGPSKRQEQHLEKSDAVQQREISFDAPAKITTYLVIPHQKLSDKIRIFQQFAHKLQGKNSLAKSEERLFQPRICMINA